MPFVQSVAGTLAWSLALTPLLRASEPAPVSRVDPEQRLEVGLLAPPHGLRSWIQQDADAPIQLEALRGQVVVLHTFAWNCSGCLRVGIPLAVDLRLANRDRGLALLSCTTPAKREETLEVMREFGVEHSVAIANPFGNASPYIDASKNSITYMFVIDRDGALAWRGDPSRDEEECLAAIDRALSRRAGPDLEPAQHPELLDALRHYQAEEYAKARRGAEALRSRHGKRSGADSVAITAASDALISILDARETRALELLRRAEPIEDPAEWVAAWELANRFHKKGDVRREIAGLLDRALAEDPMGAELEIALEWSEVASQRPVLFPIRSDREAKAFVRSLGEFAEERPGSPGAVLAEAWLVNWRRAREDD